VILWLLLSDSTLDHEELLELDPGWLMTRPSADQAPVASISHARRMTTDLAGREVSMARVSAPPGGGVVRGR